MANIDINMSCPTKKLVSEQAMSDEVVKATLGARGGSSAPRLRAAVPEVFMKQGISADDYEQLTTYMKAVKITPPGRWAGESDREVGFFLSELKSFFAITGLPKAFWGMLARMHVDWKIRKSWGQEIKHLHSHSSKRC